MEKRNILENSASFLARKSGQILNIGKIKLNIVSLENDFYNLKAELGDLIYQAYKYGTDKSMQVDQVCARLSEMEDEIQAMKRQVEKLQGK